MPICAAGHIAAALARRNIPFVFVTGYGREALPESFGQSSMLTKPFTQEQLVEAATQLIQLRQVARVAHIASYQRQVREELPAPAVALRTGKLRRKFQLRTLSSLLRVLVVKTPARHDSVG